MTPMLDGAELTARYLKAAGRSGATAAELIGALPASTLLGTFYKGRYLSRPVFMGLAEREQVTADLDHLRAALTSLPDRLFGGDLAAFARAVGLAELQVSAIMRGSARPTTTVARTDLYREASGFRVLEVNMGSAVGGIDNPDMCRELLRHPVLAAFAAEHGLGYPDTMRQLVEAVFAETGAPRDSYPMVAICDWPDHYRRIAPYLRLLERRWMELGLDAHACHVGELTRRRGRVWLRGRPVDIVYRLFLLEHLLQPGGPALIDPLIAAAEHGEVSIFTGLDAEMYGSKSAMAMLSDPANRHLLSAQERCAIDRLIPWTALAKPGPVTLEDGRVTDLLRYAASHPHELLLKPTLLHSGTGVVPGWDPALTQAQWQDALERAMNGQFVIQRRVRPEPELFPDETDRLASWVVAWGIFTMSSQFAGVWTRAEPDSPEVGAVNLDLGAHVGCALMVGC